MVEAGIATGVVMLVIMGSAIVGWILTFDQVPTRFAEWVSATISNPLLVILAMNVLLLIVGMPLDLPPAILLLGPIFVPLAAQIGLDPVQLGIIMVINLGIGLYTPPIGTTLFISSSIARSSLPAPRVNSGHSSPWRCWCCSRELYTGADASIESRQHEKHRFCRPRLHGPAMATGLVRPATGSRLRYKGKRHRGASGRPAAGEPRPPPKRPRAPTCSS